MNQKVPRWTLIYMGILTVLTAVFTIMSYIDPSFLFGEWEVFGTAGAFALTGPMGLYLARNLATAVATGFATLNRSIAMPQMAFLLRTVEDGMDAVHNMIEGNIGGVIFTLSFCLVELFGLYTLFKAAKSSD